MTIEDDRLYSRAKVVSDERLRAEEVSTVYASDHDRFIVSLIVGAEDGEVASAQEAARFALLFTQDESSPDVVWRVYDRETEETFEFTQRELQPWGAQSLPWDDAMSSPEMPGPGYDAQTRRER